MRHIIAAAASLAMALGASMMVPQHAAAAPGGGASDDAEFCKDFVEEFGQYPDAYQSVGECMGYIRSNSTSDPAQLCRSLHGDYTAWPFENFGECVNYMREFED
jgi:hypothetical protein